MPNEIKDIIRELEHCTASGYAHDVFRDWIDLVHGTLTMLPAHIKSVRESGVIAKDIPEVQTVFDRLHKKYSDHYFSRFGKALKILLDSTWDYQDVIGHVYMEFGSPSKGAGQFFTPFPIAKMMAQIHADSIERDVHDRIKVAIKGDLLAESLLLAGMVLDGEAALEWLVTRVIPSVAGRIEPLKVNDPACGSGVMFIALASCLPPWMTQMGLVQFYGQDIDWMCVKMCQINVMLYGLNGFAIQCMTAGIVNEDGKPIEIDVSAWKQESLL